MTLNFSNPSMFTQEAADIKLAYIQSTVSWAKVDRFEKFKSMVVSLDIIIETMKNDGFEKFAS